MYYLVEAVSATKGTAVSDYIKVGTPVGETALSHDLEGGASYADADTYAYASQDGSPTTWNIAINSGLNNQYDGFRSFGHIIAIGNGTSFEDVRTSVRLQPGSTEYELTNTSVDFSTVGDVGERITGTFAGYQGTTLVTGTFAVLRRPDQ